MKKTLTLCLSALMLVGLVGCSSNKPQEPAPTETPVVDVETPEATEATEPVETSDPVETEDPEVTESPESTEVTESTESPEATNDADEEVSEDMVDTEAEITENAGK